MTARSAAMTVPPLVILAALTAALAMDGC